MNRPRYGGWSLVLATVILAAGWAPGVSGQSRAAYTQERFEDLQEGGAVILVDVFADWCPTCAIQQEILAEFAEAHGNLPLHTLTVDFDAQKDVVRHFQVPRQSTLILYRGNERVWFSVAETRREVIFQALRDALS